MAHELFSVSSELKSAFENNKSSNVFLIIEIKDESFCLEGTIKFSGSEVREFEQLRSTLSNHAPRLILYKSKKTGEGPWTLITFIPDECPVQQRMVYSTGATSIREKFSLESSVHFSDVSEISSKIFTDSGANYADKPYSKREIAIQELDAAEEQAKFERRTKPVPSSGLHFVTYPLSEGLKQALQDFKRTSNWIEIAIDLKAGNLKHIVSKQIRHTELPSHVNSTEARFYLYNKQNDIIVVSAYPRGSSRKDNMCYSISKAGLVDSLKELGIVVTKKIELEEPSELSQTEVETRLRNRAASMFKPPDNAFSQSSSLDENIIKNTARNQYKQKFSPIISSSQSSSGCKKSIPIPPPGAYE
ncbi:twinfilin-like [Schistocerca gregaria]|uniref:twinfilin-like n=1 Tax=Schistocerca gregaria TaxID=7010 RepID=UPI00211ECD76|nr:twinfilin-like [Schistocerca gregaria]